MIRTVALFLLAVILTGCAEGTAQYDSEHHDREGVAWLQQQKDIVICRVDDHAYGYPDSFAVKVLSYDQSLQGKADCDEMLKKTADREGPRDLDAARIDSGVIHHQSETKSQFQWMALHKEVDACFERLEPPKPPVFRDPEYIINEGQPLPTSEIIRRCSDYLIRVTHPEVPPGTPECGKEEIPMCGSAAASPYSVHLY
jgi:hypothetical protein